MYLDNYNNETTVDIMTTMVTVDIMTPICNIGRWADLMPFEVERDLEEAIVTFTVELPVECEYNMDWDDDCGTCASFDRDDLRHETAAAVKRIDKDADYFVNF